MCPKCNIFTPIPASEPILCDRSECYRKDINPHQMTKYDKFLYLMGDFVCDQDCDLRYCGLVIRLIPCGHSKAYRDSCHWIDSDDSTGPASNGNSC
jgi:hypothetical protein